MQASKGRGITSARHVAGRRGEKRKGEKKLEPGVYLLTRWKREEKGGKKGCTLGLRKQSRRRAGGKRREAHRQVGKTKKEGKRHHRFEVRRTPEQKREKR